MCFCRHSAERERERERESRRYLNISTPHKKQTLLSVCSIRLLTCCLSVCLFRRRIERLVSTAAATWLRSILDTYGGTYLLTSGGLGT
ncbi:hypothetical protein K504DRAFT_159006 [Pleomassaria siparia CBS 279.74]|uniref:Uncharacterized protein n=1 Tax=Pleomassaria siparia CBS 279.74 TaxID=1314801 RepID=A0A6G1JUI2_9PLEO|nr:hypothetical protein K504DRAFT_159006 [Pleomassaria siparia CBS 279.74]